MPNSKPQESDQLAVPLEPTSKAAASSSTIASTTLGNPAQVAPEELITTSQSPTNASGELQSCYNIHVPSHKHKYCRISHIQPTFIPLSTVAHFFKLDSGLQQLLSQKPKKTILNTYILHYHRHILTIFIYLA
jgi:hypothetical protein